MDETEEEQQRGVTINVTTKFFQTKNRSFTILDAPGHRDFIANMITGAAQANCGILVIDSQPQAFERGWQGYQGTTKEHAILARSLGVTQLIVAINKLEKSLWSKQRYDYIITQLSPYLSGIGFKKENVTYIPISGLQGYNLIEKCIDPNLTSWWDEKCLLDLLNELKVPQRQITRP